MNFLCFPCCEKKFDYHLEGYFNHKSRSQKLAYEESNESLRFKNTDDHIPFTIEIGRVCRRL